MKDYSDTTENTHNDSDYIVRHVQTEDLGSAHMTDVMKFINNIFAPAIYSVVMFLMDVRFNFLIWANKKYGGAPGKIVLFIKNNIIAISIIIAIIVILLIKILIMN